MRLWTLGRKSTAPRWFSLWSTSGGRCLSCAAGDIMLSGLRLSVDWTFVVVVCTVHSDHFSHVTFNLIQKKKATRSREYLCANTKFQNVVDLCKRTQVWNWFCDSQHHYSCKPGLFFLSKCNFIVMNLTGIKIQDCHNRIQGLHPVCAFVRATEGLQWHVEQNFNVESHSAKWRGHMLSHDVRKYQNEDINEPCNFLLFIHFHCELWVSPLLKWCSPTWR